MTNLSIPRLILILTALTLTTPLVHGAGSGSMPSGGGATGGTSQAPRKTPQQMAVSSYNAGLNHKKRAQEYEAKAVTAKNDQDRAKQLAKAKSQYEDAVDDYRKAIGYDKTAYQAMNELGYAYRKSGDYENAVRAYNSALLVKPDFAPAIEYRGEAYLALSMFKDVKEAYLVLFGADQDQAATLMRAMEAWQVLHQGDPAPEVKAFSDWVVERKAVAANTQSLSMDNVHTWN